jgi:hypothetical protein
MTMKYRLLLEFECDGLAGVPAILSDITVRLDGVPVALLDLRQADVQVVGGAPDRADVERYFRELSLPRGADAAHEAARFYAYNEASGWRRASEWKALACAWAARIRVCGAPTASAPSFDVDEFFDAALAASMKNAKGGE